MGTHGSYVRLSPSCTSGHHGRLCCVENGISTTQTALEVILGEVIELLFMTYHVPDTFLESLPMLFHLIFSTHIKVVVISTQQMRKQRPRLIK